MNKVKDKKRSSPCGDKCPVYWLGTGHFWLWRPPKWTRGRDIPAVDFYTRGDGGGERGPQPMGYHWGGARGGVTREQTTRVYSSGVYEG